MKKLFILCFLFCYFTNANSIYNDTILHKIDIKYGKATLNRFLYLKKIIEANKYEPDMQKIKAINDFFNKVKYVSDKKVYKVNDYWATPIEFLARDKGDSEDFVFAKYFTLVEELGISRDKFYFSYVKSIKKNASYMVLAYYETKKSIPIILDSINYKALPANKRQDIIPIYSFSTKSVGLNRGINKKLKAQQSQKFRKLLHNLKRGRI